jgi:hypothetical protein
MERVLQGGKKWTQGAYHVETGSCLLGAAQLAHAGEITRYWLREAIAERTGRRMSISAFNDSAASFREIAEILAHAKRLAAAHSKRFWK